MGFIDGKFVFYRIDFTYNGYVNLELDQKQALYKRVEKMMQEFNANSGLGVNKGF